MNNNELISVAEAAEILGLTRQGLLRRIHRGDMPAKKVGTGYVIAKKDLPDVLRTTITQDEKKSVDRDVKQVVDEYGETLRKLGKE